MDVSEANLAATGLPLADAVHQAEVGPTSIRQNRYVRLARVCWIQTPGWQSQLPVSGNLWRQTSG